MRGLWVRVRRGPDQSSPFIGNQELCIAISGDKLCSVRRLESLSPGLSFSIVIASRILTERRYRHAVFAMCHNQSESVVSFGPAIHFDFSHLRFHTLLNSPVRGFVESAILAVNRPGDKEGDRP